MSDAFYRFKTETTLAWCYLGYEARDGIPSVLQKAGLHLLLIKESIIHFLCNYLFPILAHENYTHLSTSLEAKEI